MLLAVLITGLSRNLWTGFVKGALFVPVISSLVLVGIVWRIIYTPDTGIANIFLKAVGLPSLNWLGDTRLAMPSVILVSIWKSVGYFMVLYIAAIMDIPAHYYEAAKVDGANAWQRF